MEPQKFIHPIIIISEPSFNTTAGLAVAMDKIFETVRDSNGRQIIFGIVERLDWHVFNYAKEYRIPLDHLRNIKFEEGTDKRFITRAIGDLFHTEPSQVIVFRDNVVNSIASDLINKCSAAGQTVMDIDSYGNVNFITNETRGDRANNYWHENQNFIHWKDTSGGEYQK